MSLKFICEHFDSGEHGDSRKKRLSNCVKPIVMPHRLLIISLAAFFSSLATVGLYITTRINEADDISCTAKLHISLKVLLGQKVLMKLPLGINHSQTVEHESVCYRRVTPYFVKLFL